jgi:DNA-3-methyladenine glycosylase I
VYVAYHDEEWGVPLHDDRALFEYLCLEGAEAGLSWITVLRVSGTLTRHILQFDIPLPASTESDLRNPDKEQLRADILVMRADGMSYRQIARVVGLHWTRVQQIVKSAE